MKILILDLEISPTLATVWGLWNVNVGINQILGNSEVLCWAAKWQGEDVTYFSSIQMTSKRRMLKEIYQMVEEADAVISYNGKAFDMKILHKEFMMQGWNRPSPYKNIDLLTVMRSQFRFTSNKLDYIVKQLELGSKHKHQGHELWLNCMNPKSSEYESSWAVMEEYNIQDVGLTEALYERVKGWIPNHPSHSIVDGLEVCPNCGGTHLQRRGFQYTHAAKYQRYQCTDCGAWSRSTTKEKSTAKKRVGIH